MYWPLLSMHSENFGFGPGGFYYQGYLLKSGEGIMTRRLMSGRMACRNMITDGVDKA